MEIGDNDEGTLILSDSGLYELPNIFEQSHIRELFIDSNKFSMLWYDGFPPNIEKLDCSHNYISSDGLCSIWPNNLRKINMNFNFIKDTDDIIEWPEALEVLEISNNPLQKIPRNLPNSLKKIRMRHTNIQMIEHLPNSVRELDCFDSQINEIYLLPRDLARCFLAKNYISSPICPNIWPYRLKTLDLAFNFLTEFPEGLPDTLEHLNLANNFITEVPKRLPLNIKTLILRKNRIRTVHTELLIRQNLLVFSLDNNCLTDVPKCILDATVEEIQQYDVNNNYIGQVYDESADIIQTGYRLYKMRSPLRTWRRLSVVREELIAAAMHPDRYGNF